MTSTRRSVSALLVAATREHDWSEPEPTVVAISRRVPPAEVIRAASYHRVIGCVASSLRGADVPDTLGAALATAARRASGQAVLGAAAVRAVRTALGEDLPWLAIKGPVLDQSLYPRQRLRTYTDLDVLVEPARFEEAVERLERDGFRLVDRNWRQIRGRMVSQLHLEREGCAPIDLHWTLIFDEVRRRTFHFELQEMITRSRMVEVAGGTVRTFDAADTLIHLAMHAAIEGADRLVWLKDVELAARAVLDWEQVVARTTAFRMQLPVATVLARSKRFLGAPIPADVVGRLAPRSWRVLMALFDRSFPAPTSRGLGSPATLLTRSARDGVARSLGTAALGALRRSRTSLAEGQIARVDQRFDPTHEGSLLHSAGHVADREAYFAALSEM